MKGGTRAALQVGAVALLPTVAGMLILGAVIRRIGEAIDGAHEYLEDAVRAELASYTRYRS